jgi:CheY-like chemotaxis protein
MEAIGRLAGGIAHDFNNILTAILGYGDLASSTLAPDSPLRANLEEIHHAAERAAGLTRQLLIFSRKQVLQPKILDLNAEVEGTERLLRRLIGEDVVLVTTLTAGVRPVRADPGQIEQVILNLAVNARDAMPRGGRLTIETANVDFDETWAEQHPGTPPGRYVLLAVSDSGTGMDEATKSRIFEPFFTTKEAGKGTGLGLATVYGIVEQAGGRIEVESEPGRGAKFRIYLPSVEGVPVSASSGSSRRAVRGTETVLVVEDEGQVRRLITKTLGAFGYEVLEAAQPAEALRLCREHPKPIHLLLTDVVMPGMNGPDLAGRCRGLRADVKVIFMSGYTADAMPLQGIEPGLNFLSKPFTPSALASKVREVLDAPEKRPVE